MRGAGQQVNLQALRLEKKRRVRTANYFVMEEDHRRYCKECSKELKRLHLTAYSKYLCPDCEDELERGCFTGNR